MRIIQDPSKSRVNPNLLVNIISIADKTKGIMQALKYTGGVHSSVGDNVCQTNEGRITPYEGKELFPKLNQIGGFRSSKAVPNSRTIRHNRQRINTRTKNNRINRFPRKTIGREPQNTMYGPMGKRLYIVFQKEVLQIGKHMKVQWALAGCTL